MPVKISSFEPLSEEEFAALRQQKGRKTDPAMVALLTEVAAGQAVRVPLVEGQSARGLRTAIARAASSRGFSVETLEGEGFVAVRQAEQPPVRKTTQSASGQGKRRGGPRSGRSRTRPRLPRCRMGPLERARASRVATGDKRFVPFAWRPCGQ